MSKTLTVKLSTKDINRLIKDLKSKKQTLKEQCEEFVSRLADRGIEVATANGEAYTMREGGRIVFSKKFEDNENGAKAIMYGTDAEKIQRIWGKNGEHSAEVSPLLMAEFGSGWEARNPDNIEGVGQGEFPGQTHAFDPLGWWWVTPDGVRHHSRGEAPTYPMHSAMIAMMLDIKDIAREVFQWQ